MSFCKKIFIYLCFSVPLFYITACQKVDISFGASTSEADPNITFFDNYATTIATYKPDSFLTSSHHVLSLGYHYDAVFGVIKAASFAQVSWPSANPLLNKPVVFDSLELIIKPSGEFYGDSTKPMKINVYRLTENIKDVVNGDLYYNTSSFSYNPVSIGQQVISLNGKAGTGIRIRLSDALGQEWLSKFKNNHADISSAEKFLDYFKGIYINTDSVLTKSIAYFNVPQDSMLIRLSYHENSIYSTAKQMDFSYTAAKQFNTISFRHTASNFSAFINNKKQLIESNTSGKQSFLNSNLSSYIKISFPDLLQLKELHPYVRVVRAVLVIKPDAKSVSFPYQLPETLQLFYTDKTNGIGSGVYDNSTTPALQTGSLVVDNIYGENTYYSYDITSFINTKIAEGEFSTSALFLYPSVSTFDAALQRLIINDQNNGKSVQLKLYVLGL